MFDLLLFLIMAYLSITKVRFVPITAIILMPSLSFYLKETFGGIISEERRFPIFPYSRQVVSFFIILVLLSVPILTKIIQGDIHLNGRIYKTDFYQPVAPVKLMKGNGFLGNIMNEYDWGGYIHWELPDCKIFVDGRSDTVYSHEIINRWSYFVNGEEGWKSILEESGADAILIRTSHLVNDILKKLDGWQVIYFDDIASLYMNLESSRNKDFLKKWLNDSLLIEKKSFNDYIL